MHRIPIGTLKRCAIIRDVNQWYYCITIEDWINSIEASPIQSAVGIDCGLEKIVALSTGEMIENPRHLLHSAAKMRKLQRLLSLKKAGSKNRERVKTSLAKAWRKVRNQRLDYCHEEYTKLAVKHDTIVFEDLTINNMAKNHKLASAIMDATWGQLQRFSAYKVERRGGQCILVNPNGTSQKCSRCGAVSGGKLDLSVRICMNVAPVVYS
jgi:putative transposase